MKPAILHLCCTLALATLPLQADPGPLDYVNILQGTDSSYGFSNGNTLPLVGLPWGMVDWSLQNGTGGWFFSPKGTLNGLRATHQPGPWMRDYGQFVIMPQSGELVMDPKARLSEYDTKTAVLRPDYEKIDIKKGGITAELTPTERCGVFAFTYHQGEVGRLIINAYRNAEIKIDGRTIYGISRFNSGGAPANFASYFVIQLDRDISNSQLFPPVENKPETPANPGTAPVPVKKSAPNPNDFDAFVEFRTTPESPVIVKIGTSFISWDQAEQNLRAETEGGFQTVRERATATWSANLGKIEVEGTEEQKKTFYSCFYRAQMFPHRLHELTPEKKPLHFGFYDGKIHDGVLYADTGIWDAFRTTFPFITLLYPNQTAEILQGFVNASNEGGMLPEWASPAERGGMLGQHCAAIFADAILNGLSGFDAEQAYQSLKKAASDPKAGRNARKGLADYLKLGYLPTGTDCVSATLDYAYDDWCIARIAQQLGHVDEAVEFLVRAQNYRHIWDSSTGFMRAKTAGGNWSEPFDEFLWGGPYREAGAWQSSWFVPHDSAGLAGLMGGPGPFAAKLDQLFSMPPTYHFGPGGYGGVIHEMKEMPPLKLGQCALGNQPSFHIPYLYTAIGQPWKTEALTRRICADIFNASPKGFPGDEDTGSTASWYLLSSLGLYPLTPGSTQFVLTSPVFTKATLHLENGKSFVINAPGNTPSAVYVQKRSLNSSDYTRLWISYQMLLQGGELNSIMTTDLNPHNVAPEDLPYSVSFDKK